MFCAPVTDDGKNGVCVWCVYVYIRAGPAPGMTGIPVIPVMPDLPGESSVPGILLLTGITDDKQNKNRLCDCHNK